MATVSIDTGTAQQATRIADAFADVYGYQSKVPNPNFDTTKPETPDTNPSMIDNPVNKAQFVKQQLVAFIKQTVAASEGNKAADTARKTAVDSATQIAIN